MENWDIQFHSSGEMSIKNNRGNDIDLKDNFWDNLFAFLTEKTEYFYFKGSHINYIDEKLDDVINNISDSIFFKQKNSDIFIKLNPVAILINRQYLSKLWSYYEHSILFLLIDDKNEVELSNRSKGNAYLDTILFDIKGLYILHGGIESNVIWIKNSSDMPQFKDNLTS